MIASLSVLVLATVSPSVPSVDYRYRNVPVVAGGFVTGVIAHPKAKDVVYCRTDIGGAYRLDPNTRRWLPLQDWLKRSQWTYYGVESIGLDPSDRQKVYLAVGTYTNSWSGNGAILKSADQGKTWQVVPLPFKNGGNEDGRSIGERLAVDPNDGRVLYFGTRHEGLWKSVDSGSSWAPVTSFPVPKGLGKNGAGLGWVLFDRTGKKGAPTQRILVGPAIPGVPIQETTDGGKTWRSLPGSPTQIPHHAEFASDGSLYVTTTDAPGPNGVQDGAVWKRSVSGVWTEITPIKPSAAKRFGFAGLSIDPKDPQTLIVSTLCRWGQDTIFRSRDGGSSWVSLAEKSTRDVSASPYLKWDHAEADFGHWIGDCEIDPFNPKRVWYVTGATIYGTDEVDKADRGAATKWYVAGVGIEETAVIDLASPPRGMHVMSGLGDIGGFPHFELDRPYQGGMLKNPLISSTDTVDFAEHDPDVFIRVGRTYGEGAHGGYSLDGGRTWKTIAKDPPGTKSGGGSATVTADGKFLLWAPSNSQAYWSEDWGKTWSQSEGLPPNVRLVADREADRVVYAQDSRTASLYVSKDGGRSFALLGKLPSGELGRLRTVFGRAGHLWVPSSTGLFSSKDGGKSFVRMPILATAESVSFGKAKAGSGYPAIFVIGKVAEGEGVFRSTDGGTTWERVNSRETGFGTMMHICGDPKVFGRFYIGTNGRGVLVADPVK